MMSLRKAALFGNGIISIPAGVSFLYNKNIFINKFSSPSAIKNKMDYNKNKIVTPVDEI